ncbi:Apoptotic protease-activating factor 1 [Trichoplax sp. H2]|nr:Apoptotic protease-activating factor 1 [Trichoplax sp. H2]|eukprot:RDD42737.1 Apoptotic protease-activating factor 1 [Trichoplax sp. H2]
MSSNENDRYLLRKYWKEIKTDMNADRVGDILYSRGVLTSEKHQKMRGQTTNWDKNNLILNNISNSDSYGFEQFRHALNQTTPHLAGIFSQSHADSGLSTAITQSMPRNDKEELVVHGGVPDLPSHFVQRIAMQDQIRAQLNQLRDQCGWVILVGMAGCGKTVLASRIVREDQLIEQVFPGGITWLTLGRLSSNELLARLQDLCMLLDCKQSRLPNTLDGVRDHLRRLIYEQHPRMILILDNIWDSKLISYLDLKCRTLATTRDSTTAKRINSPCNILQIEPGFHIAEAKAVLSSWTGIPSIELPSQANSLISKCKGLPLAISIFASLLSKNPHRWDYYISLLTNSTPNHLRLIYQSIHHSHQLEEAIRISIDSLDADLQSYYYDLAVFENDIHIPSRVLNLLWNQDIELVEDKMEEFVAKSLALTFKRDDNHKSYIIHNLLMFYLKETHPNLSAIHNRLIDRYCELCNNQWHLLDDDGYIYAHLVHHLIHAKRLDIVCQLLTDPLWLQSKLDHNKLSNLLNDYMLVQKTFKDKEWYQIQQYYDLIKENTDIITGNKHLDIIQLILNRCQQPSIVDEALQIAQRQNEHPVQFQWCNQHHYRLNAWQLSVKTHNQSITACHFSNHDQYALAGLDNGDIKIWNCDNATLEASLNGHVDSITAMLISPDENSLITSSLDETVKIWLAKTGHHLATMHGHNGKIKHCRFSSSGSLLVSCGEDGYVKPSKKVSPIQFSQKYTNRSTFKHDIFRQVWDLITYSVNQSIIYQSEMPLWGPLSCHFLRDDSQILCSCLSYLYIIKVEDGTVHKKIPMSELVNSLEISQDRYCAACIANDVQIWDLQQSKLVTTCFGHCDHVNSVAFSRDGSKVVTGSDDETLKVWDFFNIPSVVNPSLKPIYDCQFEDNNNPLLYVMDKENNLLVYYGLKATLKKRIKIETGSVTCCKLSRDCRWIAIGCSNGQIIILDTKNGQLLAQLYGHMDKISFCNFINHDERILSASYDGYIKTWHPRTGEMILEIQGHQGVIWSCCIAKDESFIATASHDCLVKIWYNPSLRLYQCLQHGYSVMSCDFSSDAKLLLTGSDTGIIKVWNISLAVIIKQFDSLDNREILASYFLSGYWLDENGNQPYFVTVNDKINWYSLEENTMVQQFYLYSDCERLLWTHDFRILVTIDWKGVLYIIKRVDSS